MLYFILKALHIASVVLFLGNIITGVFWKRHGDRSGDHRARVQALDGVIRSDRLFTVPGVLTIIVTGVLLATTLHLPILGTRWIGWSLGLFGVSGILFGTRVGPLQKQLLAVAQAGVAGNWNEAQYDRLSRSWELWGLLATALPLVALFLMVMKPV